MEIAMVDEIETGAPSAAVTTDKPAEMPVAKKQRAPRRSKAEIEATLSGSKSAATVKSPIIRKKRAAQAQAAPVVVETPDTGKITTKGRGKNTGNGKPASQGVATAAISATDEMADLIQLEAENKRLRLALAEKLRVENADLRKRLGA
jgi:putative transposase